MATQSLSRYIDIDNITIGGLPNAMLVDLLATKYCYSADFSVTTEADRETVLKTLEDEYGFEVVHASVHFDRDAFNSLYKTEFEHFSLNLHNKSWSGAIVGNDIGKIRDLYDKIIALLPPLVEDDPTRVYVKFWSFSGSGASPWLRQIDVQAWDDLKVNYPPGVSDVLDKTLNLKPVVDGGKLILWHGVPGTGKTHAIRALAQTWKAWCSIEYVIDPERFFGDANYMVQCLMGSDHHDRQGEPPWRLIIIEDAGEFIREDAAAKTGQGLSRLLNLTDGLIGQGLRIIVLMTTNEKFNDLAESVQRTGRCLSHLEFREFSYNEATAWLGTTPDGHGDFTLADLYAMRTEEETQFLAAEGSVALVGVYL